MQKVTVELPNGLNAEVEVKRYRAQIIHSPKAKGHIIVPKFVEYESKKYLIIGIGQESFRDNFSIKSLSFPEDSRVRNIDIGAFTRSSISQFFIPASLETLNEMWCSFSSNLFQIEVSPDNKHFNYQNEKFLFNQSNDTILFSRRNILGNVIIPKGVKKIAPNAFSQCKKIKSISFETSILESIEKFAFYNCQKLISIEALPPSLKSLGYMCFSSCFFISLEFLGNSIFIDNECFNGCTFLSILSLPNVKDIKIASNAFSKIKNDISIFVPINTDITIQYFH